MIRPLTVLADVNLPDALGQKVDSSPSTSSHFSPLFIGLAVAALALVAYLVCDIYRQKREERRQRQRLERFREKKFKQVHEPPA
jgi:hypothetical protein